MNNYEDIINLPHHVSTKRPQMPLKDRAAQFAPFAALTCHDEAIAKRPVFVPQKTAPFARAIETEFSWNGGFAPSQKQKNIRALHSAFQAVHPYLRIPELSSKSMQENGAALSAFALPKYVPASGKSVPVETYFRPGRCLRTADSIRIC